MTVIEVSPGSTSEFDPNTHQILPSDHDVGRLRNYSSRIIGAGGLRRVSKLRDHWSADPQLESTTDVAEPVSMGDEGEEQKTGAVNVRNQWLDQVLDDPNRPLPKVGLEKRSSERLIVAFDDVPEIRTGNPRVETDIFDIKNVDDHRVGFAAINKPKPEASRPDKFYISDIEINERHKGYGPAAYLAILKSLPAGAGLRTEGVLSPDARRVWALLETKGVARELHPGEAPAEYETVF